MSEFKPCYEDLPSLHLQDFRRRVGGRRRLKAADYCDVTLSGECSVRVLLVHVEYPQTNPRTYLCCPDCGRHCHILYDLDGGGLYCRQCVRRLTGACYSTQRYAKGHPRYSTLRSRQKTSAEVGSAQTDGFTH